ncbi:MAG: hypothetical protein PHO45_01075 [Victivallaceae bacterium]|nr:hypothetical protein [Victivallaceae bacterium]
MAACFAALLFSGCRSTKEEPVNEGKRTASAVDEYVSINKITDQDTLILGQEYKYEINLTNDNYDCGLVDFTVMEEFGPNFKFIKAIPEPDKLNAQSAVWNLGDVKFGETKTITIVGTAKSSGTVTNCTKFSYNKKTCNTVAVVSPKLKLEKTAPKEVVLCDAIPVTLTVCNTGTGTVNNVEVTDTLPEGLVEALTGKTTVTFNVASLAEGQCQEFTYNAKALRTGTYLADATASSKENLTDKASTTTVVKQAILKIAKDGTETIFIGRPYTFTITVTNVGDTDATNVRVVDSIPQGAKCVSLTEGGVIQGDTIVWNVEKLQPKAIINLKASFISNNAGMAVNRVAASAACSPQVEASAKTDVIGIPAILLEVVDIEDPLAVGGVETYVITATNQGSAPATNVKIICSLEDSQEYVSGDGASAVTAKNGTIECAPYPSLQPGAKATWNVRVKALKAGDVRFKTVMTSDQLSRPVEETEATNQY